MHSWFWIGFFFIVGLGCVTIVYADTEPPIRPLDKPYLSEKELNELPPFSDASPVLLAFHNWTGQVGYRLPLNGPYRIISIVPTLQVSYYIRLSPHWQSYAGFQLHWNMYKQRTQSDTTWLGTPVVTRTLIHHSAFEFLVAYRHFFSNQMFLQFQLAAGVGIYHQTTRYTTVDSAPVNRRWLLVFSAELVLLQFGYRIRERLWLNGSIGFRFNKIMLYTSKYPYLFELPLLFGITYGAGPVTKL